MKNTLNRLYEATYVGAPGGEEGGYVCVVATSSRAARSMAFGNENLDGLGWVDIKIRWLRHIDVSDLPEGEIDVYEGVVRGAYAWTVGVPCDDCGKDDVRVIFQSHFKKLVCCVCEKILLDKISSE